MENIISNTRENGSGRLRRSQQDEDREMNECLAKLKVWQTENLMAPHGMDRFAEKKKRIPKMSTEASKEGSRKASDL